MRRSTLVAGGGAVLALVLLGAGLAAALNRPQDEPFVAAVEISSSPSGVIGGATATTGAGSGELSLSTTQSPTTPATTAPPVTPASPGPAENDPAPADDGGAAEVTSAATPAGGVDESDSDDGSSSSDVSEAGGSSGRGGGSSDGSVPAGITSARAASIALGVSPGTVDEVKLDSSHGSTAWKVEITGDDGVEYEIRIDPASGAVLSTEVHD